MIGAFNSIRSKRIYQSIKINVIGMLCIMLFFEPFWSITDYNEVEKLYGIYIGECSYQTKFVNFIYGKFMLGLIHLCDKIPWYTVTFYFLSCCSMIVIIYFFLKNYNDKIGYFLAYFICFAFAYELYARINFTKVAAVLGAASVLLIIRKESSVWSEVLGAIAGGITILIRYDVGKLTIAAYFLTLIFCFFYDMKKKAVDIRWYTKKCIVILGVLAFLISIPYIKYSSEEERTFWNEIFVWNDYRVTVQDYDLPDYNDNKKLYDEIGVSENDLYIWRGWNDDCFKLNGEIGKKLYLIQERSSNLIEKCFNKKNIYNFLKLFPLKFLTIDAFFVFVVLLFYYLGAKRKRDFTYIILYLFACSLAVNYYLFINGRYLQHRVDVGVIMIFLALLITFTEYTKVKVNVEKNQRKIIMLLILMAIILVPTERYADDVAYISGSQIEKNHRFFEYTNKHKENVYLIGNSRDLRAVNEMCYRPFEVPEAGLKSNIIMGANPENITVLENNGINNPYVDIVDNEHFYLVLLDGTKKNIKEWEQYISDSANKTVECKFVKKVENKKIYKVYSKE